MPYKDKEKQKKAQRLHYEANKDVYISRAKKHTQENRKKLRGLKESSPCEDCNQYFPFYVMQYDHIGNDKSGGVNPLVRSASWKRVLDEIAKCELVCANCHAVRTWKRYGIETDAT